MSKGIRRRRFVATSGAIGFAALAGCIGEDAEPDDNGDDDDEIGDPDPDGGEILEWAAGGQGGTYYPLSGDFKSIVEEHTGHGLEVQTTGASVENVGRLQRGEADFALIQNDVAYFAYHGTGIEELEGEEMDSLRAVGSLYPETIHIVTQEDSGIDSIEDLDGATVNVGDAGSGTEVNAQQILETAGVDVDEQTGDFETAADQIRDGGIDAAIIVGGWRVGAVEDLATSTDISLVEIPDDVREDVMDEAEWFAEDEIPGGTYDGVDDDVQTVSVQAMIATHEGVDEGIVEEVTEAIFENTDDVTQKEEFIDAESAQDAIPIDFHPGAEAYFG